MSVRTEILKITKIKASKKEEPQALLTRALETLGDTDVVSEEDVDGLSEEANAWVQKATEAFNADKVLPTFEEFDGGDAEEAPAPKKKAKKVKEAAPETAPKKAKKVKEAAPETAPKKAKKVKEAAPEPVAKKAKKGAAKNEGRQRSNTMQAARLILIKQPALGVDELVAAVHADSGLDIEVKTARSLRYHTLATLKDMRRLGLTVTDKKGKAVALPE